jgi:carboxyl-terminal processing protease
VPKNEIIVTTKSKKRKNNNTYKTAMEPVDTEIPLVIIINDKVLQHQKLLPGRWDLDRAVIVEPKFWKRFGAKPIELMYNTQLKVTISRYYTPSGRCIQALDYAHKDKMEQPLEPMKKL